MTTEEINELFPPSYGGAAQISDLRLALSKLASQHELGGVEFSEVQTIQERDELNPSDGHICKVHDDGTGNPQTYIFWNGLWIVLVENVNGGSPTPTGTQVTEKFIINAQQEQDQKITLQHKPDTDFHLFVFLNGMYLTMGTNFDYTLSNTDLLFNGDILTSDDILTVKYTY